MLDIKKIMFEKSYEYSNKLYTFEDIIKLNINKEVEILTAYDFENNSKTVYTYLLIKIYETGEDYVSYEAVREKDINYFIKIYKNEIKKIKRNYNINKLLDIC